MKLWIKILIALVLGMVTGLILGPNAEYLKPIGTLFLNLINMIIVPLILSSITIGITSIHDPQKLGRVGFKTLLLYLTTTLLAILIGFCFAYLFQPGNGLSLASLSTNAVPLNQPAPPTLSEILLSIIPKNPIAAMVEGNFLQIIVFSMFFGDCDQFSRREGKAASCFFRFTR